MTMKFDTNIPLPPRTRAGSKTATLAETLGNMPVDASVFTDASTPTIYNAIRKAREANPDASFTTRTWVENGVEGKRIWRLT